MAPWDLALVQSQHRVNRGQLTSLILTAQTHSICLFAGIQGTADESQGEVLASVCLGESGRSCKGEQAWEPERKVAIFEETVPPPQSAPHLRGLCIPAHSGSLGHPDFSEASSSLQVLITLSVVRHLSL